MTPPVICLLRALPGDSVAPLALLTFHEQIELVNQVGRHGLSVLAEAELRREQYELPDRPRKKLRTQAASEAAVTLRSHRLLLGSLDALSARAITPLVLKGLPLARRLYADPIQRLSTDVDLWIPSLQRAGADQALRDIGLVPSQQREAQDHRYHVMYSGAAGTIELHHQLLNTYGRPVAEKLFLGGVIEASVEGHKIRTFAPEEDIAYLAIHATHHLLQRLSWLFDLKLYSLHHPSLDWDRVVRAAISSEVPSLAFFALSAARDHLGAGIPREVLRSLEPSKRRRFAAERLFDARRLATAQLAEKKWAWNASKLLLAPSVSALARQALARARWRLMSESRMKP